MEEEASELAQNGIHSNSSIKTLYAKINLNDSIDCYYSSTFIKIYLKREISNFNENLKSLLPLFLNFTCPYLKKFNPRHLGKALDKHHLCNYPNCL